MVENRSSLWHSSSLRWILAILVTLASAVYQRVTGPTYPVEGETQIAGTTISYKFSRSHGGEGNQPVSIAIPDTSFTAHLIYRRYPTSESWTQVEMRRNGTRLESELPHQPPAGKIEYYVSLTNGQQTFRFPDERSVVTRFKGSVPTAILLLHIFLMFLGMLFSTRTGIEALDRNSEPRRLAWLTLGFLTLGGMILGPLVQKFAFGALWTGAPFGWDLTDNKTLIAFLAWLGAILAGRSGKKAHAWILVAAGITLVIFLIPHSMMGSELKYE